MFDGNIRLATRVVDACPVRMAIRYGLILVSLAGPFFTGSPSQAQTVPTVSFTIAAQSAPENSGSTVVTAALSVVTTVDVTVPYTLSGTALNPQDFTISPNTIVIPAGNLTADATVTIINDVLYELDETIVVTMGTPVNANPGAITTEVVTILDNDPAPTIDVNNATVSEGAGVAVFTVSLSALSGRTISVDYATADNTAIAGLDYTAAGPQTLTFAPGETSKDVWISIFDDLLSEGSESFQFNLSNPVAAALGVATGIGTILDNDALPVVDFTSGSQSAVESAGTLTITAMLSTVSGQTVRVPFTVGGTASNPADYAISASPIIIPAGSSSGTITISLTDDLLDEAAT